MSKIRATIKRVKQEYKTLKNNLSLSLSLSLSLNNRQLHMWFVSCLLYMYISKSWIVVFIFAMLQLSHIIAMSQSFYFPFLFGVSTSYIVFNQSHSLSQLIIFPSNKRLMFILLMTFQLNPNSLKFSNRSFFLSDLSSPYNKKTASFPPSKHSIASLWI